MDIKVMEFLQQKQAVEYAALLEEKQALLKRLKLRYKVVVENPTEGYDGYSYDAAKDGNVYYKFVYPEISNEEYKALLKYDIPDEDEEEGNGESGLNAIATIALVISVLGCIVCFIVALDPYSGMGWPLIVSSVAVLLAGLVQFWAVKVFTNISRKATAIYKSLQKK